MKTLKIRRRDDDRSICEIETDEAHVSKVIKGILNVLRSEWSDWGAFYYIDDSEFSPARITGGEWFLWLVIAVIVITLGVLLFA